MKNYFMILLILFKISIPAICEKIEITINKNYYPFEFINEKGNPDGFTIDLIYAIARESAIPITFKEGNWRESDKNLFSGSVNLIPRFYDKTIKNDNVIYSTPLFSVYFSLYSNKEISLLNNNYMKEKLLLLSSGDSSFPIINNKYIGYEKIGTRSWSDSIKGLSAGTGDIIIISTVHGILRAEKAETQLFRLNNFELIIPFSLAAAKWDETLIDNINNGVSIIKASGEFDRIYKKWFGELENIIEKKQKNDSILNLYTIISASIAVLIFLLLWRKKQKI